MFGHKLYGDGIHDDSDAMAAYVRGEKVYFKGKRLRHVNGQVYIPAGIYKISNLSELIGLEIHGSKEKC